MVNKLIILKVKVKYHYFGNTFFRGWAGLVRFCNCFRRKMYKSKNNTKYDRPEILCMYIGFYQKSEIMEGGMRKEVKSKKMWRARNLVHTFHLSSADWVGGCREL